MKYQYKTNNGSGEIHAGSAVEALQSLGITREMVENGAWAWVENEYGMKFRLARNNVASWLTEKVAAV